MSVTTFRDLDAWDNSMALVEQCYKITEAFPIAERYGLTSQLRRAAISIPSNIAEGYCRRTTRAYANHVSIALGSHGELETCIELASRFGWLPQGQKEKLTSSCASVGRLLTRLYQSLERKLNAPQPRAPSP